MMVLIATTDGKNSSKDAYGDQDSAESNRSNRADGMIPSQGQDQESDE